MFNRNPMTKKRIRLISVKLTSVALLSSCGLVFIAPTATAADAVIQGSGACWVWNVGSTSVNELDIYDNCNKDNRIHSDGYDGFGTGRVGAGEFGSFGVAPTVDNVLVENQITVPGNAGEDSEGSSYTISFSNNNVTYLINSASETNQLRISGNLGSDFRTIYTTIGSHFISYQVNNDTGLPYGDPIFLWETNGTYTRDDNDDPPLENGGDRVRVSTTGYMLQLKHYAYAHRNTGFSSPNEFFNLFLKFVDENKNRTDVFTIDWRPAPVPVYVRQSSNLTFAQSLYASDTLSDPDGQLRKTVDQIMNKYGSLIK